MNCIVIALFAIVHAIDPDGSILWGVIIVVAMVGQIFGATRPERRPRPGTATADEVTFDGRHEG